jgi:putative ABC transport system substrate-binding protein
MRRREFITLLGGAAAWPLAAQAQQGGRVRRIGLLMPYDESDPIAKARLSAFTQALADLGWTASGSTFVGSAMTSIGYSACNPISS